MMEGAFFVGKRAILQFLNDLLKLKLQKIEETASGVVACSLTDIIFPGTVNMKKVNWGAKHEHEYVQNYKVLQDAFKKAGVSKVVPVQQLIRGKYQDNLEFMQWFKRFFEINCSGEVNYDAVARRNLGKGGGSYYAAGSAGAGGAGAGASSSAAAPRRRTRPSVNAGAAAGRTGRASAKSAAGGTGTGEKKEKENTPAQASGGGSAAGGRGSRTGGGGSSSAGAAAAKAALEAEKGRSAELARTNSELQAAVDGLEKERDFYFGKLRDVEILLQSYDTEGSAEAGGNTPTLTELKDSIFKILYAADDDFVDPEEAAAAAVAPEEAAPAAEATAAVEEEAEEAPPVSAIPDKTAAPAEDAEAVVDPTETF